LKLWEAPLLFVPKTGTITQNTMSLQSVYSFNSDTLYEKEGWKDSNAGNRFSHVGQ
jgi:Ca2+-transporting ATPase